jgi:hypothetical protein
VSEDLRRAFAFLAKGDMGGAHREVSRFGLAVFDEALPLRYDSNYLLVDALPDAVSADDLAQEARRLDRRDASGGRAALGRQARRRSGRGGALSCRAGRQAGGQLCGPVPRLMDGADRGPGHRLGFDELGCYVKFIRPD